MTRTFRDPTLTVFLAIITKDQKTAIENLAKLRGYSKSRALRLIIDDAIKSYKLK